MNTSVQEPVALNLPDYGIRVAESIHGATFRMGVERHDFHQIYVVRRGRIALEDERLPDPLHLDAGSLWPIPAGVAHRMDDSAESILFLACLGDDYLRHSPSRSALWDRLTSESSHTHTLDPVLYSYIITSLNRVLAEQWQKQPGYDLIIAAELDQLLVRLCRSPVTPGENSAEARVRRVVALVDVEFYEVWDIERAAAQAHLSRRRFTTLFRTETGQTFNTYLSRVRLEHALSLLRGGNHSIPGAAFASGLSDISHFYRLFKRYTGTSPGHWVAENSKASKDLKIRTIVLPRSHGLE